jgi:hypothetical protein
LSLTDCSIGFSESHSAAWHGGNRSSSTLSACQTTSGTAPSKNGGYTPPAPFEIRAWTAPISLAGHRQRRERPRVCAGRPARRDRQHRRLHRRHRREPAREILAKFANTLAGRARRASRLYYTAVEAFDEGVLVGGAVAATNAPDRRIGRSSSSMASYRIVSAPASIAYHLFWCCTATLMTSYLCRRAETCWPLHSNSAAEPNSLSILRDTAVWREPATTDGQSHDRVFS